MCAVNAVLYRRGGGSWALTEARPESVERRADLFALSGSRIERCDDVLTIHLDERTAPWGRALRGRVRIALHAGSAGPYTLDQPGDHHWWPIGARAGAEVELDAPALRFRGSAYHDCNFGRVPLEQSFDSWNWSRAETGDDVCVVYDVREVDGTQRPFGLRLGRGGVEPLEASMTTELSPGWWGVQRATRGHGEASIVRTLEDTPFYTRSLIRTTYDGRPALAMHESLSMTRFVRPWVQCLLPFRIRRGWRA